MALVDTERPVPARPAGHDLRTPREPAFAATATCCVQLPGRAASRRPTTLLPPHVFLGSSVRDEREHHDVAEWLDADDPRPVVYVGFGRFLSARDDVLASVVAALRPLEVRVELDHRLGRPGGPR